MSASLNLRVVQLAKTAWAQAATDLIVEKVAHPIEEASDGDIQLSVKRQVVEAGNSSGTVSTDQLHRHLEKATGFQRGSKRVDNIGLLVADAYQPRPDFFGLMFDSKFSPSFEDPWASTPREGCAVFLGGIEAGRSSKQARLDEALYTAIHELAHVFNIQHSDPPSYMAQSAGLPQAFNLSDRKFTEQERKLLAQCSTSKHIWPGGSAFEDLGTLVAANASTLSLAQTDLRLEVGVSQDSFWAFEPVELDVVLRLGTHARAPVAIRDKLDPGYHEFKIWIEEPSGERRIYRTPKHFCGTKRNISLLPGGAFKRDITLFGESGAYTFRTAGRHRVWVTLALSHRKFLISNQVEIEVRPERPDDRYFAAASGLLRRDPVAQLLFHRELDRSRRRWLGVLEEFCIAFPRRPSTAMIRYALGCSLTRHADALRAAGRASGAVTRASRMHLKAAAARKQIGDYRCQRAERHLAAAIG